MPGLLRPELLEEPKNRIVDDLCIFARERIFIHNLCKTGECVLDAFSELDFSVTEHLDY